MRNELYLLPYAGGSSLSYFRWEFGESIDVVPLDYKGHGTRFKEKLDSSFEELTKDITSLILNQTDGKNVNIFGHSMGSLVAWDVVNRLNDEGVECRNLIVSACPPPHLFNYEFYKSLATEDGFLRFIHNENRLRDNQVNSKLFREVIAPVAINDYKLLYKYRRRFGNKLRMQITCLYGDLDSMFDKNTLDGWQEYSTKRIIKKELKGNHYYIEKENNLSILEQTIRNLIIDTF